MFRSKALKDFSDEKQSKVYNWWIETRISKYYYDFMHKFIENPIFQVKRLYQWYMNVFRYDYDFDGHSLFAIIEYKLKRIQKVLHNGHAIQEPQDMKALRVAIKLAGRLKDDKYDEIAYDRHEKKWGEMENWLTPYNDGSSCSLWNSSRPKAVTEEEKERESADFRAICLAAEAKMKREEKWMYDILHKHVRSWWD